jgi:hypothetical protein
VPDPGLDVLDYVPRRALIPLPVQVFSREPQLDYEIRRQVLRLELASLFLPEAEEGAFVAAHDDPGIRASDERTTSNKFAKLRCMR